MTGQEASGLDPTTRFSDRVSDYARHRPGYPEAILDVLRDELGLRPEHVVADVGSGTGILTRLFLERGFEVHAVEPNRAMAKEAEAALRGFARFHPLLGRAEETGLGSGSVDLVAAGQAFHWFEAERARDEFRRILRPPFRVALAWNLRRLDGTPFLRAYEAFLQRWALDYRDVSARYADPAALATLFGGPCERRSFPTTQRFDFDGLRGRLLSSSYAPGPGHERHAPMLEALPELFAAHARDGTVSFEYETALYFGRLR